MVEDVIRRRVVVRGRVQGVFFRDSCRQQAQEADVTGWVSNEPDGSVVAVFEGSPDAVRRLVEWCRTGPPSARVIAVGVDEEPARGERRFSVR
ncbi:MAG: acylphosphatase [Nocardioidaceae bacterium]